MGYYLQTKFRGNLKGSSVFCVDLTWNDPKTTLEYCQINQAPTNLCILLNQSDQHLLRNSAEVDPTEQNSKHYPVVMEHPPGNTVVHNTQRLWPYCNPGRS